VAQTKPSPSNEFSFLKLAIRSQGKRGKKKRGTRPSKASGLLEETWKCKGKEKKSQRRRLIRHNYSRLKRKMGFFFALKREERKGP